MQDFELIAHPIEESVFQVQAWLMLQTQNQSLRVRFEVTGELERLRLPSPSPDRQFVADLSKQTCFECFYSTDQKKAYEEWNFSPSGNWWRAEFSSYRDLKRELDDGFDPQIRAVPEAHAYSFQVDIPFRNNARLGLSCILHTETQKFHHALVHCDEQKADFHLWDSMIIHTESE